MGSRCFRYKTHASHWRAHRWLAQRRELILHVGIAHRWRWSSHVLLLRLCLRLMWVMLMLLLLLLVVLMLGLREWRRCIAPILLLVGIHVFSVGLLSVRIVVTSCSDVVVYAVRLVMGLRRRVALIRVGLGWYLMLLHRGCAQCAGPVAALGGT